MPSTTNNLYPPVIKESYIPAFIYTQNCRIYFSISEYNSTSQLQSTYPIQLVVQKQNTNQSALDKNLYPSEIKLCNYLIDESRQGDDKYYITISNSDIQNGFNLNEYYKVQLRFTGAEAAPPASTTGIDNWLSQNLEYFSEWSTVSLIYGISQPTLSLIGLNPSGTNTIQAQDVFLSGSVSFAETQDRETLTSFRVFLYDSNNNLLEDTNEIFSDDYRNSNKISCFLSYNFQNNSNYSIKVHLTTKNLYEFQQVYAIRIQNTTNNLNINLQIEPWPTTGSIKLTLTKKDNVALSNGTILKVRRTSHKENFNYWSTIKTINITQANIQGLIFHDYTAQPGVWYKYQIVKVNNVGSYISSLKSTDPYMVYTEDVFLVGDGMQLRLRYNTEVSSLSIKTAESASQTIGSPYPYISRNGNLYYKNFSLSAMITHFSDLESDLFESSEEELYGAGTDFYKTFNTQNNINHYHDYIREKEFRNKVIKFLNSDSVKLFKSLTEGNILVKIGSVSFAPNSTLARLIYDFSCSVTEIDDNTPQNCIKYNISVNKDIKILEA